jgi:hypothetical protein
MMEPALFSAANLFDAHSSGAFFFFFLPSFLPSFSLIHSCYDVWRLLPPLCIVSLFVCCLQHAASVIKQASCASEIDGNPSAPLPPPPHADDSLVVL